MLIKVSDCTYVNSQNVTHIDFARHNDDTESKKYMVLVYVNNHYEESLNAGVYKTKAEVRARIEELVYLFNELPEYKVNMREV